jgi:hypothetical protein
LFLALLFAMFAMCQPQEQFGNPSGSSTSQPVPYFAEEHVFIEGKKSLKSFHFAPI